MARIRNFPEQRRLHRLKETEIIHRPRPNLSILPRGGRPNLLTSYPPANPESRSALTNPEIIAITPPTQSELRLLLDTLTDLSDQYMAYERMQNKEVENATLALVQLRCHEYRSLWSTEERDNVAKMLKLYEELVEEVRSGRTVGVGGMRVGDGGMRDIRRELALGIRKAVRDGVRIARHSGPGAG